MSEEYIDFLIPERRDPNFWEAPEKSYSSTLPKQKNAPENSPLFKLERDIEKSKKQKLSGIK